VIEITHKKKHIANFIQDGHRYLIEYLDFNLENSLTLSLPNTQKFYLYDYKFPPFLESFLPEGYLYEIFKALLAKEHGRVDEYLMFSMLSPNIEARIAFLDRKNKSVEFPQLQIEEILDNDTEDLFGYLVKTFLEKNAIGGVQPKSVVLARSKERLQTREYIVKTWGDEYPDLARNEYFSLQVAKRAGLEVPKIMLSKNYRFLIVEKFTLKKDGTYFGFEEICSLMGKNRDEKYSGSYEQVAKTIYTYTTNKKEALKNYYKTVVVNFLVKNGDAHLKNFGLLFEDDFSVVSYAPAYDIVNTVVYIYKDKPALTLGGKKVWWNKERLVKFGQSSCMLTQKEATYCYDECLKALKDVMGELREYLQSHPDFFIGKRMLASWSLSLNENTIKEMPDELVRSWRKD